MSEYSIICIKQIQIISVTESVANNRYQVYCTPCKKALELSSLGITSLQSHAKSEKHKVAVKGL